MPKGVKITKGSVTVNDRTQQALAKVKGFTADGLRDYAQTAADITKSTAPVRKKKGGNHRSLVGFSEKGLGFILFSASNYGAYLEFGTSKMPARPHFRPALTRAASELRQSGAFRR